MGGLHLYNWVGEWEGGVLCNLVVVVVLHIFVMWEEGRKVVCNEGEGKECGLYLCNEGGVGRRWFVSS